MTIRFKTLPPSTNHLYGRGQHGRIGYLLPKVREAKEALQWEARSQHRGRPLGGDLAVEIQLVWPDKRRRDVDNVKILLDAMSGILWDDDSQITDLHILKDVDKADPHVEMWVWELS